MEAGSRTSTIRKNGGCRRRINWCRRCMQAESKKDLELSYHQVSDEEEGDFDFERSLVDVIRKKKVANIFDSVKMPNDVLEFNRILINFVLK